MASGNFVKHGLPEEEYGVGRKWARQKEREEQASAKILHRDILVFPTFKQIKSLDFKFHKEHQQFCPVCKTWVPKEKWTRDHIIPQWFARRVHQFGIDVPHYKLNEIQKMCQACNFKKGGYIDYAHPHVREFMSRFAKAILAEVAKHQSEP